MGENETIPETQESPSVTEVKESAVKKYLAELLGTFVLVFMGVGSAVFISSNYFSYVGFVGVAFAFGLSLLVMVYAIGGISGCHINPAVSISMLVAGKMKAKDTLMYIIFQCIGGVLGAGVVYGIAMGRPEFVAQGNFLAANGYGDGSPLGYSLASCFIAETVLTFVFLMVIHGSTSEKVPKGFAGIPIGLSLVMIHIVSIPITNTSVNPARSLGPAIFVGQSALSQLWLFWVAPILGGILAALVWRAIKS
jgi:aquaporin Z